MSAVLLAVGNAGSPDPGDTALEDRLSTTLGHTVTRVSTTDVLDNTAGQDLIVITASGSGDDVGDLSGVSLPVWSAESFNWDNQGWVVSGSEGFTDNDTDGQYLELTNNHHPITAAFPLGLLRIYTTPPSFQYMQGTGGGDGRALGVVPGFSDSLERHYLAAYDTGDALPGGGTAPDRICLFGAWDDAPVDFNDNGWELFDRSISWLLGTLSISSPQLVGSSTASASAGPYSASDYWTGDDNLELAVGDSQILLFELTGVGTTEDIWGNSSASTGWIIGTEPETNTYGESPSSRIRVTLPGGSGDLTFADSSSSARLQKGLNCVAVTHVSGGDIKVSVNGGRPFSASATYVAPSSATHYLGRSHAGNEASSVRVIQVAAISESATDLELRKWSNSVHELDNGRLNSEVTGHASLIWDVHFGDDWDGVSSTAASSGGSGSNTFTATGTIGQTTIGAQDVYSYPPSVLADTETPSETSGHYECDSWATLSLTTDSTSFDWSGRHTSTGAYAHVYDVGLDVDGAYSESVYASSPRNIYTELARVGFTGLSSASKTLTAYPGTHKDNAGEVEGLFHAGQFRVDAGATVSLVSPSAPTNRLVVVGDSIVSGIDAVPASQHCFATQLRRSQSSDWNITFDSSRSRALHSFSGDLNGLGNDIAARCNGTAQNVVLWELGTNDYGDDQTASSYQTNLETVLDAINAADTSIEVLLLTLLTRDEEGVANGAGDTPEDFRTAQSNVQAARSSWVTLIDGPASVTHPTNFHSDGLHPNNAGHDELQTAVEDALPAPLQELAVPAPSRAFQTPADPTLAASGSVALTAGAPARTVQTFDGPTLAGSGAAALAASSPNRETQPVADPTLTSTGAAPLSLGSPTRVEGEFGTVLSAAGVAALAPDSPERTVRSSGVTLAASGSAALAVSSPIRETAPIADPSLASSGSAPLPLGAPAHVEAERSASLSASGVAPVQLGAPARARAAAGPTLAASGSAALAVNAPSRETRSPTVTLAGTSSAVSPAAPLRPSRAFDAALAATGTAPLAVSAPTRTTRTFSVSVVAAGAPLPLPAPERSTREPARPTLAASGTAPLAASAPVRTTSDQGVTLNAAGSASLVLGAALRPARSFGVTLQAPAADLPIPAPARPAREFGATLAPTGVAPLALAGPERATRELSATLTGLGSVVLTMPAPSPVVRSFSVALATVNDHEFPPSSVSAIAYAPRIIARAYAPRIIARAR